MYKTYFYSRIIQQLKLIWYSIDLKDTSFSDFKQVQQLIVQFS